VQRLTHCKRGHEFTPENSIIDKRGWRKCRRCHYDWHNEHYVAVKKTRRRFDPANPNNRTHCKKGHPFTPENTLVWKNGLRRCRICNVAWHAEHDNWEIKKRRAAAKAARETGGGKPSIGADGPSQQEMSLAHLSEAL
jgi:hypothetical protein